MSLAHLQLLEMASKVGPSVADKPGLELPFNSHLLIIKKSIYGGLLTSSFWFCISKPKDDKVMSAYETPQATVTMMQIFYTEFIYCTLLRCWNKLLK